MHQQLLFPDTDFAASVTALTEAPQLGPNLTARLRRLHVRVLGLTWNEWFQEWHFRLYGPFGTRGTVYELTKTATGVQALVAFMERRKR